MRIFLTVLFSSLLFSCSQELSPPSGKSKRLHLENSPDSFGAKPGKKSSRAPQMGFYYKKPKTNTFANAKFKVKYVFANKKKKHRLGNEQTSTSQSYSNQKQSESLSRMNQSFTKGRLIKRRKGVVNNDRTSDSFAKNPNKKGFRLFRR